MVCIYCVAGFPHDPTDECELTVEEIDTAVSEAVRGRPVKANDELQDALSTGRKRAKEAAPINAGMVCEWAFLKEAGGGIIPITGCPGYPASDRHHGPDKNTLNNVLETNLHRICDYCHNRWHAFNDKFYAGVRPKDDTPWLPDPQYGTIHPHNPDLKMTRAEVLEIEIERSSN